MKNELNIIMPMFNAEKTIINTLKGLEKQSNHSFELIVVDDGSTDHSVKMVEDYISKNNTFSIKLISQPNGGPSHARNTGIKNSSLKYIMFIDSDDFYERDMVDVMLRNIKEKELQLVTCGILKKIKKNVIALQMGTQIVNGKINIAKTVDKMQDNEIFNYVWNKIYCLDIIKENNILFNNRLTMGEDFQFNLYYIDRINKMKIISDTLYLYNTDDSFITNAIRENEFENRKENIELLNNYFKKNNFDKDLSFQYVKVFYSEIFNNFKANGYLKIRHNKNTIKKLLRKNEIRNLKKNYTPDSRISSILFNPIKKGKISIIYLVAISAIIGKKLNLNSFKSKSM